MRACQAGVRRSGPAEISVFHIHHRRLETRPLDRAEGLGESEDAAVLELAAALLHELGRALSRRTQTGAEHDGARWIPPRSAAGALAHRRRVAGCRHRSAWEHPLDVCAPL